MPHDVFISYSSHDKTVADATCAAIEAQKIRCWIAPRDVLAGTEYGESIVNAIEDCRAMVLVFSGHANKSPHTRREVERAVTKSKFIVPFRIEDVVPSGTLEFCLGSTHWLDALTPPLEKRISELVDSVRRLIAKDLVSVSPSPQRTDAQKPTPRQYKVRSAASSTQTATPQSLEISGDAELAIKIDWRLNNEDKGKILRMPYVPGRPVYDFLDEIYYFIAPGVEQSSFGKAWMLVDAQTENTFEHLQSNYDQRSLLEVGIKAGAVLLVKLL